MKPYKLKEVALILEASLFGNEQAVVRKVSIDSRTVQITNSVLFFAIKGVRNDSHKYIPELYQQGIRNFVISNSIDLYKSQFPDCNFIFVNDSLYAFQKLIAHHRCQFNIPVVGITGSNGKTICKEWIYYLLADSLNCFRSPKSYNSQVGVPLSVNLIDENHELAIIEAGISQVGEMEKLEPIVKPSIGLITNIGEAHQKYFNSYEEKVLEKLKLFTQSEILVYCKDHIEISKCVEQFPTIKKIAWSYNENEFEVVTFINSGYTDLTLKFDSKKYQIQIPYSDAASIENAIHSFYVISALGYLSPHVLQRFSSLPVVKMRLEQVQGENSCLLINDTYNSDIESVTIAIDVLNQQQQFSKKTIIISDIEESGLQRNDLYNKLMKLFIDKKIDKVIAIGNEISEGLSKLKNASFYNSVNDFIENISLDDFSNEAILIKGARKFQFERITRFLEYKTHRTRLEIKLNAIINNLNYFKGYLEPGTKVMAMVKGFSYGSGSYEIANILQHNRVDYLGVAFIDEGISLRNAGVLLPILVLNPEPLGFSKMFKYNLEPEVFSVQMLDSIISSAAYYKKNVKIHLKFDTGMGRMGFTADDVSVIAEKLSENNQIEVASVFSHLAGSDSCDFDDFTNQQFAIFKTIVDKLKTVIPYKFIVHILNSAGIERFSEFQFDMVRIGIGLYGVSAINGNTLESISTLKAKISQIRHFTKGTSIGYSRKWILDKDSNVAVISIGYADGLDRRFSNGVGKVIVNGVKVPIIGNVCMDATMIDVTDVDCKVGDDVIIFGSDNTITALAESIGTIPYEILTNVSQRVKRIYIYD